MAQHLFDEQGAPSTPSSGKSYLFPHSSSKQWASKDSAGKVLTIPGIKNCNLSNSVASGADTYLVGSALAVPSHGLQAGTIFKWRLGLTKTAAGVAAPTWIVRVGTLGTTGDAARLTFTGTAQTAAVDSAFVELTAIVRDIGASGIVVGLLVLQKAAVTAVGFTNTVGGLVLPITSAGFDTAAANLIVGVSVNPGASGVWTHQIVKAEALNL